MKNAVFWDVAPCVSCKTDVSEECDAAIFRVDRISALGTDPEDGGNTFLRNVGSNNTHTAPHPRGRHNS
jgi:hypothetical protein